MNGRTVSICISHRNFHPCNRILHASMGGFYTNQSVEQFAAVETKKVTLRQLLAFGRHMNQHKLLKSANLVRKELTVRIAHRIRDFQKLPFIVGTNPRIELAYNLYCEAFDQLRKFREIKTIKGNDEFCLTLRTLLKSHLVVIPNLAAGMMECRAFVPATQMDKFMNDVLRTRIGRRVLAEQHITLSDEYSEMPPTSGQDRVGIISTDCRAVDIVESCTGLAHTAISADFQIPPNLLPQVRISGNSETTFTYIPDHIEYIVFELLKNSMASHIVAARSNGWSQQSPLPPVDVMIWSTGNKIVWFRVSDQGGGFSKDVLPPSNPGLIWSFSHQYQSESADILANDVDDFLAIEMAGKVTDPLETPRRLRIGLQLAHVFANYWGGEIDVCTMYGYGSDVYVRIDTTGEGEEQLTTDSTFE